MPRSPLAIGAIASAVALVVVAAIALAGALDENGEPPPPPAGAQGGESTARLVDRVRGGLVLVTADRGGRGGRSGSGFMVDEEGFLVTSRDVVAGAQSVAVQAEGASGPIAAEVVGTDPATDVALLKIPRDDADALRPLKLGDDPTVRVGEPVVAVGAPFGLEGTVTAGIVSALDRTVESPGAFTIEGAIQIDAAISAGNSGGPLIDTDARVIGVNTRVRSPGDAGLGFALPIDTAEEVVESIREHGDVDTPFIGAATVPVSPGLAGVLALSVEHGLLVRSVTPGSPAARAGLRAARPGRPGGDVIVSVDGQAVREPRDAALAVQDRKAGDRVTLEIVRGRRRQRLRLTLAEGPG
jgi:S1-C subfamily serine protease